MNELTKENNRYIVCIVQHGRITWYDIDSICMAGGAGGGGGGGGIHFYKTR